MVAYSVTNDDDLTDRLSLSLLISDFLPTYPFWYGVVTSHATIDLFHVSVVHIFFCNFVIVSLIA
jgi:hypothetical protein